MADLKDIIQRWIDGLDDKDRYQVELLDSYFTFRSNLPDEANGVPMVEEPKTTADIQDDLSEMMPLNAYVIFQYMRFHEYGFTTLKDGTVKWAIWRMPE